nr:TraM recognition domain-containing protein [Mycoplasmopsis bovis]
MEWIKQFVQTCNLLYFLNSNDEDTLKELSESLGKKEVKKISNVDFIW